MFTQKKKNFYIIGSNPKDFFDMTIEGTEAILKSDVVIISKNFHNSFINFLIENNKNIIFKEDLAVDNGVKLLNKFYSLLKKYNSIGYLVSGDPYFSEKNYIEDFLKKKKINVIKTLGLLEVASWVNKKNDFLTNREKNSSVFFCIPSSLDEIKKNLSRRLSGKLVIIFREEKLLNNFLKKFQNKSKVRYKLYINGNRQYLKNMPFILERQFSNAYLVLNRE